MFNLFNKNVKLVDFKHHFTKEQKAAIVGSLIVLAKSDGEVHSTEMQNIELTGRFLGIGIDDPMQRIVALGGKNEIFRILNTLDKSQKEWYVIALNSMVVADGRVEDIEIKFAVGFAESIGISEKEYFGIIHNAESIMDNFK